MSNDPLQGGGVTARISGTESPEILQGVPKKMVILSGFEFLTLGGVFVGVKNNSRNFGNKINIGLLSKIL